MCRENRTTIRARLPAIFQSCPTEGVAPLVGGGARLPCNLGRNGKLVGEQVGQVDQDDQWPSKMTKLAKIRGGV